MSNLRVMPDGIGIVQRGLLTQKGQRSVARKAFEGILRDTQCLDQILASAEVGHQTKMMLAFEIAYNGSTEAKEMMLRGHTSLFSAQKGDYEESVGFAWGKNVPVELKEVAIQEYPSVLGSRGSWGMLQYPPPTMASAFAQNGPNSLRILLIQGAPHVLEWDVAQGKTVEDIIRESSPSRAVRRALAMPRSSDIPVTILDADTGEMFSSNLREVWG